VANALPAFPWPTIVDAHFIQHGSNKFGAFTKGGWRKSFHLAFTKGGGDPPGRWRTFPDSGELSRTVVNCPFRLAFTKGGGDPPGRWRTFPDSGELSISFGLHKKGGGELPISLPFYIFSKCTFLSLILIGSLLSWPIHFKKVTLVTGFTPGNKTAQTGSKGIMTTEEFFDTYTYCELDFT